MRIVLVAQDAVAFERHGGVAAVVAAVKARSGSAYDPDVGAALTDRAASIFERLRINPVWEAALAAEPLPHTRLGADDIDRALEVFADFADLKSCFTLGHSRRVAGLAADAAASLGIAADDAELVRRAALVHDLGRLGVANSIWDKPGPLTSTEWERVRLGPYLTSRMLSRAQALAPLAAVAASHQERLDGSGYHRGLRAEALSIAERILACADALAAMLEPRAHRVALSPASAAAQLRRMAADNLLDGRAAEAVIGASGQPARRPPQWPAGLSEREVEVLRHAARGLVNKETARHLGISERTVAHHLQHIYDKIGVSTRGAAALFAVQHGLF
jgi:DNA-binding CsgD family transcriptional regulator